MRGRGRGGGGGGGGKRRATKKKEILSKLIFGKKKVPMATKLKGGGGKATEKHFFATSPSHLLNDRAILGRPWYWVSQKSLHFFFTN